MMRYEQTTQAGKQRGGSFRISLYKKEVFLIVTTVVIAAVGTVFFFITHGPETFKNLALFASGSQTLTDEYGIGVILESFHGVGTDQEKQNDISFTQRVDDHIKKSLQKQAEICAAMDREPSVDPSGIVGGSPFESIAFLETYCLVEEYEKLQNNPEYLTIAVSKAEAIQMLAKIHSVMYENVFDLKYYYAGELPYDDVNRESWYLSAILYMDEQNLLEGVERGGIFKHMLEPLKPIRGSELRILIENVGGDAEIVHNHATRIVTKKQFYDYLLYAFGSYLPESKYLFGENMTIIMGLAKKLQEKGIDQQKLFLKRFVEAIDGIPIDILKNRYNLDKEGMIMMVESYLMAGE